MKKTLFAGMALLLMSVLAIGQSKSDKADVLWGPELRESKKMSLGDIAGYDDSGMYLVKHKRGKMILEHYDTKMVKTKSKEVDLKYQKKERDYKFMVHADEKLYLFSSYVNNKTKKNYLFVESVNKKTLGLSGMKKIAEIDISDRKKPGLGAYMWGYASGYNMGSFRYDVSRDESKIMIYFNLPRTKGDEKEKLGIHVFDSGMEELWRKDITLPYADDLFSLHDYTVSNSGNVYLLGKEYKEKKDRERGEVNYKYRILGYLNNGQDLKKYLLDNEDHFLYSMKILVSDENDILCSGFYSDKGALGILGSYFLRIDGKTKEVASKSFKKFDKDFVLENLHKRVEKAVKKREKRGKETGLYRYRLDDIILRSDGGALLVGEQFYTRTVTTTSTSNTGVTSTRTTTYYYNNDIIIININPDGEVQWTKRIAKKQVSTNTNMYSSYVKAVVKDKIYFVFNDNAKNLNYKGSGGVENFKVGGKNAIATLVTMDKNGNQEREALFNTKDADVVALPMMSEQVSKNEVVLFGNKRKTRRFAKVTFK